MTHSNNQWLYFNIHDLVRMRVQAGHPSQRSVRLVFGPFETEALEKVDLTLQYDPPLMQDYSFGSEAYIFTSQSVYVNSYKLYLLRENDEYVLASKRDLLPFVPAVIQMLLLNRRHCFIHSAAITVNGQGVLLPGWGGTGKTSAIICILKEIENVAFMGDDYTILDSAGRILSFPKAFFIYPYHRELFPHLFKAQHKPLIPPFLSGAMEKARTVVRPMVMAFPKLENFARRFTPEHMQVPARTALPEATFANAAPLNSILFIERYIGQKVCVDELELSNVLTRLTGNWFFEQGQCARDLMLGAAGTAVFDYSKYFSGMETVIRDALANKKIYRLRMGKMSPADTGRVVVDIVRNVLIR